MEVLSNIPPKTFEMAIGLQNTQQYLHESYIWYEFVMRFHNVLAHYDVQKNLALYQADTAKLIAQFSIEENSDKNIDETDLNQFLEAIHSAHLYENVKNMTVNAMKMKSVKAILKQNMNQFINSTCSAEHLFVHGYNIKMSDILDIECFDRAKFIKIFALNKFFIDANFNRTTVARFSIVAFTWEIIDERKLILNGQPGQFHAMNSALQIAQIHQKMVKMDNRENQVDQLVIFSVLDLNLSTILT